MTLEITEEERQLLVLALARLLLGRPGWRLPIEELTEKLQGHVMFAQFLRTQNDFIQPDWILRGFIPDGQQDEAPEEPFGEKQGAV